MTYSFETSHRIYNDKTGDYIEIGPDRDSLVLCEIRTYYENGKINQSITFTYEELPLIMEALKKMNQEKIKT